MASDPVVVVQPATDQPEVVVQGAELPIVVIQPPPDGPVTVIQPATPDVVVLPQPTPAPVVVINPSLGSTGGGGGGFDPVVYRLTALSSWTVSHGFPYLPAVRLIENGEGVDSAVEYPADNEVHISFPSPFTGIVILS